MSGEPFYEHAGVTIHAGDCLEVLRTFPPNSIDAVVCDPPYHLTTGKRGGSGAASENLHSPAGRSRITTGFMGKAWDGGDVAFRAETWREVLRVLKPGAHLLAFGGTRTFHRLVCAIEDAGFEIRDAIGWIYGQGFPKSLDVSKAIDKARHDREEVLHVTAWLRERRDAAGLSNGELDRVLGYNGMAGHWTSSATQPAVPTLEQVPRLLEALGVREDEIPSEITRLLFELNGRKGTPGANWSKREFYEKPTGGLHGGTGNTVGCFTGRQAKPGGASDEARAWEGWGTALKPALEPVTVARKPFSGTVAENVLQYGTGAINVDACRIGSERIKVEGNPNMRGGRYGDSRGDTSERESGEHVGRFPANLIHDGSDEVLALFPETEPGSDAPRNNGAFESVAKGEERPNVTFGHADAGGSAARFFYTAKADRADRGHSNTHPTVKPLDLMRYLVRLVTPAGAIVLDPFAGSGSTLVAAKLEQCRAVGIELDPAYCRIATKRLAQDVLNFEGIE